MTWIAGENPWEFASNAIPGDDRRAQRCSLAKIAVGKPDTFIYMDSNLDDDRRAYANRTLSMRGGHVFSVLRSEPLRRSCINFEKGIFLAKRGNSFVIAGKPCVFFTLLHASLQGISLQRLTVKKRTALTGFAWRMMAAAVNFSYDSAAILLIITRILLSNNVITIGYIRLRK